MEELMTTFQGMDTILQVFWVCATVASLIFVIQFVLMLIGLDHSDIDIDIHDGDTLDMGGSLNLFTIKNVIGFFVGFGWTGVCFYENITPVGLLIFVAILVGLVFVAMFVLIYKQTRKLDKDGTFSIQDCLGRSANVYLRIPQGCEGKGKIQISINGSVHEIDALTDEDKIESGMTVTVVEIVDNETVKVINQQHNLVI